MKKTLLLIFLSTSTVMLSQKSAGLMSQEDDLSKNIGKMHDAYESANFDFWDQMISPEAVVYLNNTKMNYKTMRPLFVSHHTIFNNIKISNNVTIDIFTWIIKTKIPRKYSFYVYIFRYYFFIVSERKYCIFCIRSNTR